MGLSIIKTQNNNPEVCIKGNDNYSNYSFQNNNRERRVSFKMEAKEIATMERLWAEKSKNGSMPSYQMCMILPQIRKSYEVDEEAVDEMITELDKEENGLITEEGYKKVCEHFLGPK